MIKKLLLATSLLCAPASATDLKPWFPRYLEFQAKGTFLHQQYCEVDSGSKTLSKESKDDFYTASLELAYDPFCGEIEATCAATGRHHLGPDNIKATLRYQILDDITGDSVSLVAGISLAQVFALALKDISSFHHGGIEGELHLSVGKENSCLSTWNSRWWAVGGIGVGDHGSPWLHGEAAWEKNWEDKYRFRLFMDALYGTGHNSLHLNRPFHGYGGIRHQSIDIGGLFRYATDCALLIDLSYARRVHAANSPKDVNLYVIAVTYPFGI